MRQRRLAAVGVALAFADIGWAQYSGAHHNGHAGGYSLRIAAVLSAWLIGAFLAAFLGRVGVALVAVGVMVAVAISFAIARGSLSGRPLAPPLHYGNANGAWAAAAVAAGGLLMTLRIARPLRAVAGLAAIAFLVVCHQTHSAAAQVAAIVTLAVCATATVAPPALRKVLAVAAPAIVVLAAVFTAIVGVSFHPGQEVQSRVVRIAEHGLTERRAALWHDATVIVRAHPVDGVGPGGFATASPVARADPDARWAHSAWLQQASEEGVVGLVLLAGAIAVGWWMLVRKRADATAVAGSWALGSLLIQASIDHVVDLVAVPIVVALLAGAATAGAPRVNVRTARHAGRHAAEESPG